MLLWKTVVMLDEILRWLWLQEDVEVRGDHHSLIEPPPPAIVASVVSPSTPKIRIETLSRGTHAVSHDHVQHAGIPKPQSRHGKPQPAIVSRVILLAKCQRPKADEAGGVACTNTGLQVPNGSGPDSGSNNRRRETRAIQA